MAYIAACTDKGVKRRSNQDACCVQVANTVFGELLMAIVCDGVGGLAAGELASASVIYRFVQWFNSELPMLIEGMDSSLGFNFAYVETVWGVLLNNLNDTIQSYGRANGEKLGTTFTGILICEGNYLVGHVGDCRLYQISPRAVRQVTDDQTLLAKKLASGEITPQEVSNFKQGHVILQSVGTEGLLRPVFYHGTCSPADLFVLCCDGAYRKAENAGVASFFQDVDYRVESQLDEACKSMLRYDIDHGETDNLTVVCVSADLVGRRQVATARTRSMVASAPDADAPTMVEPDDADLPTMVEPDDADAPTLVEDAEADTPTLLEEDEG